MRKPLLYLLLVVCLLSASKAVARQEGQGAPAAAVLSYDFDSGPDRDWRPLSGIWTMIDGAYTVGSIEDDALYLSTLKRSTPADLVLTTDIHPGNCGGFSSEALVFLRMSDKNNGFCFWMDARYGSFYKAGWGTLKKGRWEELKGVARIKTPMGKAVRVKIEKKGDLFRASVDGREISRVYDASTTSGDLGIGQVYAHWFVENPRMAFNNLHVRPLDYDFPSVQGRGPVKATEEPSQPAVSKVEAGAPEAKEAAFRAERSAQRAEQAAKAAQDAARRSESMAGKAEGIMERVTAK
jgi:hypothetical protein